MTISQSRCKNTADALVYMIECELATIEGLICKKNPPIGELKRHISIAQAGIDFLAKFNVSIPTRGRIFVVASTSTRCVLKYAEKQREFLGLPLIKNLNP